MKLFYHTSLFLIFTLILSGCSKDKDENTNDQPDPEPKVISSITITNINNIPADVTFDRVEANITGECWSVIGTVVTKYEDGKAIIQLPTRNIK